MKRKFSILSKIALSILLLVSISFYACEEDDKTPSATITSFIPESGPEDTEVTITGTHFSTTAEDNLVSFNSTVAVVKSASASELKVNVPSGATTGKISVEIDGVSVSSTKEFTFIPTPTITDISPKSGTVGTEVTITGTNFSAVTNENTIKINDTAVAVKSSSTTTITIDIPADATSGQITVEVNGIIATSSDSFTIEETPDTAPTISSFSPTSAAVGAEITITGTNFSTDVSKNIVEFNGTVATVKSATLTELKVAVPASTTSGKIKVTVEGNIALSTEGFVIISPAISSFSPTSGLVGTEITIAGTNFSTDVSKNVVEFNGTAATVNSASLTELKVIVPAGATSGKIKVTVEGTIGSSADDFSVLSPAISGFSPTSGLVGTEVTITGTFSGEIAENIVTFNGTSATIKSATASELIVDVPNGATTGKIKITISDEVGQSELDFTVETVPTIASFSASKGIVTTKLTITGTNFSTVLSENIVKFGGENGTTAVVFSATETELVVFIPNETGSQNVHVAVKGHSTSSTETIEVLPEFRVISLSVLEVAVGAELTIHGFNFLPDESYSVSFLSGGHQAVATVKSVTASAIVVDIPDNAISGANSVRVETLGYRVGFSTGGFRIFRPWELVGTNGDDIAPGDTNGHHDMAVAEDGTVYVVYREVNNQDKLSVKKFNGITWELVGGQGISDGTLSSLPTIVAHNNTPYIMYTSFSNTDPQDDGLRMKKFDGMNWVNVGNSVISSSTNSRGAKLAFNSTGKLYIGYLEPDNMNGGQLAVKTLNASNNWTDVGTNPIITTFPSNYFIGFDAAGTLIAAGKSNQIATLADGASDWTVVTTTGLPFVREGSMAMDSQGNLYYAYNDINFRAYLAKLSGATWSNVISEPLVTNALRINLAFASDIPHVAYTTTTTADVSVYKMVQNQWNAVGDKKFRTNVGQPRLVFDNTDDPYVMFANPTNMKVYSPKKLD
ncbi:MAG: IPT/TIG domain-containing protein [Reichenbachiella sp.]|uniref:IPT/TIG domain-containing protein n=1 Tax=Reichenbachiella sp. TaxID=2184521 RepID=UPI0032661215